MEAQPLFRRKMVSVLAGAVVLLGLYAARLHNYLLFHSLAEVFSVVVACSIFLVAWNARRSQDNHYFLFVGIAYLFAGVVDLVHMLGYKGMGVFPGYDANLPTQLWIGARYLQAISLLIAPRFAGRSLDPKALLAGYAVAVFLLFASVFAGIFPDCYLPATGLTPFKVTSEYAICAIFLASIFLLYAKREHFERDVLRMMVFSIAVAVGSEFLFTLYRDVYGFFNLAGHFLKILSFFLVYRAVIGIDLARRFELNRLLQQELEERKRAEESLVRAKEEWERTFDAVPEMIAILDDRHRILRVNEAMARRLGRKPGECIGLPCHETVHGLPKPPGFCPHARSLKDGRRHTEEVHEDSLGGDFLVSTTPLFGRQGERIASVHVARDITESKRAAEELRAAKEGLEFRVAERTAELAESEERFRSLVEHSPVGIFIVRGGRVVFRNPEQARLFGPMPENFEFRAFRDVHPEDASKFGELVDSISSGGEPAREIDLRFFPYGKSSEGVDLRWVHAITGPMEYGGEKAVLVSMADITRLKEMEYQFLVREKMASLGHVATGIAHEIRNPLSGINIHLSALERILEEADGLDGECREQAAGIVCQIQSASERIESVIKKVMGFSRPSAVRTGPADINLAIENAIDFTATQMRRERITLDRSRLEILPKCNADPPLITQVVMNLIVNAAQAMEEAQDPRIVEIASTVQEERIVIRVSDSGPGIPPERRDKIFDPFYTTRRDGNGIGLSFCRRVIADHHGLLTADVSRWGGAEFRIELPLEPERGADRRKSRDNKMGNDVEILER
jgi:PAS domain S-box-containing protein